MRQTGCLWDPFWLSFLKNLHKDINRPGLQYWMSWCFPSKFSIRDTDSDLIFESMGMGTDGHGWAPMGRSLFFRTANSLSNAATPPFTEICTKIQTNVFKTRNTSLRKGTSWQHSTNHDKRNHIFIYIKLKHLFSILHVWSCHSLDKGWHCSCYQNIWSSPLSDECCSCSQIDPGWSFFPSDGSGRVGALSRKTHSHRG